MTKPEAALPTDTLHQLPVDIGFDELLKHLVDAGIPVEVYGTGAAKTVGHLLSEINEGEATVTRRPDGTLHRSLNVLWVEVMCSTSDGSIYYLREDRQELKGGHIRRRALDSSIGEKLKADESPEDALVRALQEELGITEAHSYHKLGFQERTFFPDSFPGIESSYRMHQYAAVIPESQFDPEGYVEYQGDKTNYYVWERVYTAESNS